MSGRLNEGLFSRHIARWMEEFCTEHPDADGDALADKVLDADLESYEVPSDFMRSQDLDDLAPDFAGWWRDRYAAFEEEAEEAAHQEREWAEGQVVKLAEEPLEREERVASVVVDLCLKNPDYAALLAKALAIEADVESRGGWWSGQAEDRRPFGWTLEDIQGMTGGHVAYLVQQGILRYGYKSSNYAYYRLVNPAEVSEGLSKYEQIAEEKEAETGLEPRRGFLQEVSLTDEDLASFQELLAEHDGLDYWWPSIAPKVVGVEKAKKAVLLALASTPDKHDDKNRIHVLLFGPPGSAKSRIARTVTKLGGGWCSLRTSKVGLTADASGRDLTPGALPKHHGGVVGIDELDKFSAGDQAGCLDAMEEGEVHIQVGKFDCTLPAEAVVVATANEMGKLKPELLDRFDFTIHVDLPSTGEAEAIMREVIEWWNRAKAQGTWNLGKYLKWVRQYNPEIPQDVRDKAKDIVAQYIIYSRETRVRRLESILRVALSIARLNRRDVEIRDVQRAIKLLNDAKSEET